MMQLGAATHFSQGWPSSLIGTAVTLGADLIRDTVSWTSVERTAGSYTFTDGRVAYVDAALRAGLDVSLMFQPAHPLYDGGKTPHSPAAITAFADFVVATLDRFPGVGAIEIGNEFNGENFVTGTVLTDGYSLRPQHYADLLKGVATAVAASHPDVTVVGGAMHSVPVGYAMALAAAGAFEFMDAVAIHPYTTDPEQLADQLALLDAVTGDLPIHVTEFGQEFGSLADAPAYLVKMTAVMAAAGVESAQWYALYEQPWFDNMELVASGRKPTPAGESFAFVQDVLLGAEDAVRIDTESSAYAYSFGEDALVLWGDGQRVSFSAPVTVYDATGHRIAFDGVLRDDAPVVVVGDGPLVAGDDYAIGETGLLADSYHDFDVAHPGGGAGGGPWSYHSLRGDGRLGTLVTMPGGERANEPWTPYIGSPWLRPLVVNADTVNPVDFSGKGTPTSRYSVLERMTAEEDATVTIAAHWDVVDSSANGIDVAILLNGRTLFSGIVFDRANGHVRDVTLTGVVLEAGDTLDFVTGPNGTSAGSDKTERSFTVRDEADAEAALPVLRVADGTASVRGTAGAERIDAAGCARATKIDALGGGDAVVGGAGNDSLIGNSGRDTLLGGAGNDTLAVDAEDGRVDGGDGIDLVRVSGTAGVALDLAAAGVERAVGGAGDDRFDGARAAAALSLDGAGGGDVILGGAGADTLGGGSGADRLGGGAGNDTLTVDADDVGIDGGDGVDLVRVAGTAGVVLDLAAAAVERAVGGAGGDRFDGAGAAAALSLAGGAGDDTLAGGAGRDTFAGGLGDDAFALRAGGGGDRVDDFARGDVLLIDRDLADDAAAVVAATHAVAGGLLVDFGVDSLFLRGATLALVDADAMIFV